MNFKAFIIILTSFCFATAGYATSRTKTDEVTASDGGPVAFPAGITIPTANGDLVSSATYSATLTAGTNVAAVVTPVTLKYTKEGTYYHVYGQVSIDPTSGTTLSTFTLSLPSRATNFTGTGGAAAGSRSHTSYIPKTAVCSLRFPLRAMTTACACGGGSNPEAAGVAKPAVVLRQ